MLSDIEYENDILSLMINSTYDLNYAISILEPDDFHEVGNGLIFDAIYRASKEGVQMPSIKEIGRLIESPKLKEKVFSLPPGERGICCKDLCERIKEMSVLRKAVDTSYAFAKNAHLFKEKEEVDAVRRHCETMMKIGLGHSKDEVSIPKIVESLYQEALESTQRPANESPPLKGFSTGFSDLDHVLKGLAPGRMIVIGARPGVGKTSLMLNMVSHLKDFNVVVFSLEMTADELVKQLVLMEAGVKYEDYQYENYTSNDVNNIKGYGQIIAKSNISIIDDSGTRPIDIRTKLNRMKLVGKADIVFIDYLQLIHPDKDNYENNQIKVTLVSRALKKIAKEFEVPVVVLAQVNRNPENRVGSSVPQLSDLRESGAIEADADQVIMLTRPEMLVTDEKNKLKEDQNLELYIQKNRFGPTSMIRLSWNLPIKKMRCYTHKEKIDKRYPIEEKKEKVPIAFKRFS